VVLEEQTELMEDVVVVLMALLDLIMVVVLEVQQPIMHVVSLVPLGVVEKLS
jgi:hypothetical protein